MVGKILSPLGRIASQNRKANIRSEVEVKPASKSYQAIHRGVVNQQSQTEWKGLTIEDLKIRVSNASPLWDGSLSQIYMSNVNSIDKSSRVDFVPINIQVLNRQNLLNGKVDLENATYLAPEFCTEIPAESFLQDNDLVFDPKTHTFLRVGDIPRENGGPVGKVIVAGKGVQVFRLRARELNVRYVAAILQSKEYCAALLQEETPRTVYGRRYMSKTEFPIVSQELQERIVDGFAGDNGFVFLRSLLSLDVIPGEFIWVRLALNELDELVNSDVNVLERFLLSLYSNCYADVAMWMDGLDDDFQAYINCNLPDFAEFISEPSGFSFISQRTSAIHRYLQHPSTDFISALGAVLMPLEDLRPITMTGYRYYIYNLVHANAELLFATIQEGTSKFSNDEISLLTKVKVLVQGIIGDLEDGTALDIQVTKESEAVDASSALVVITNKSDWPIHGLKITDRDQYFYHLKQQHPIYHGPQIKEYEAFDEDKDYYIGVSDLGPNDSTLCKYKVEDFEIDKESLEFELSFEAPFGSYRRSIELQNPFLTQPNVAGFKSDAEFDESIEGLESPYIAGKPVGPKSSAVFKGREDELATIRGELAGAKNVVLLEGNRRSGKSSILKHLVGMQAAGWFGIHCDLQDGKEYPSEANGKAEIRIFEELTVAIAKGLQTHPVFSSEIPIPNGVLKKPFLGRAKKCREGISSQNPYEDFVNYLNQVLAVLADRGESLVLLIDEFDKIFTKNVQLSPSEGLANLRALIQKSDNFTVVFAGATRLRSKREEYSSTFFGAGIRHEVAAISKEAAEELITEPLQEYFSYSKSAIDLICEKTACRPFLIQNFCTQIFNYVRSSKKRWIEREDCEKVLPKVIGMLDSFFDSLWKEFREPRTRFVVCQSVAAIIEDSDIVTFEYVREKLDENSIPYTADELEEDLRFLKDLEVFTSSDQLYDTRYNLALPLFGTWVSNEKDLDEIITTAKAVDYDF